MLINNNIHTIYLENYPVKLFGAKKAYAWYSNYRLDLLSGKKEIFSAKDFQSSLIKIKINERYKKRVIHLTYEFGLYYVFDNYHFENDILLGIDIEYTKKEKYYPIPVDPLNIYNQRSIDYSSYKDIMNRGRVKLVDGECYQFNLTFKHLFNFDEKSHERFIDRLFSNKAKLGAYAHATWIPNFNKLILSNSPECLFNLKREKKIIKCWTMPIKGSLQLNDVKDYSKKWDELKNSTKDQAELYMIADLLRNDLSKIEKPEAVVVEEKSPLLVPGILHQYSLIKVNLSLDISLGRILEKIFPGGSITGAPKMRVMEILSELEFSERGFYTGSTIILDDSVMASSINIRTAIIDFNQKIMQLGAGGGITLLSNPRAEFNEMFLKVNSFLEHL